MTTVNGAGAAGVDENAYKDDEDYKKLMERSYNPKVAAELVQLIHAG